jgi:glycosyltransferase involved in cell wall biosynthesis
MAMLMQDLGFCAPHPEAEARLRAKHAGGEFAGAASREPALHLPAAVLNGDPLISYSGIVPHSPLGLASIGATPLRGRSAWFLISPTWSIEDDDIAEALHERAVLHRHRNANHRLIFMCNTPEETGILQNHNEAAFFYNKTANTPERVFRALDGVRVEFDAIYNAQLVPWKRHELSLGVKSCGFLFYRDGSAQDAANAEATIMARHAAIPGHVFINPLDDNKRPIRVSLSDVNRHLNRAGVGLCLSEKEGAMFASTEYLLSGLPIVTTPSTGGRHVYHDDEYCRTVAADPRSVADAVNALNAKGIPRAYIRDRTLGRLAADRMRFLSLINAILEECGAKRRLANPWPFRKEVTMEWLPSGEAVDRAAYGVVDGFARPRRGLLRWRRWRHARRAKQGNPAAIRTE